MENHKRFLGRKYPVESLLLATNIVLLWIIVLICKKIYPFGNFSLVLGDGAEQILPAYTHVWDVLHGYKSLFFDWYTGLGDNMAGTVIEFALISPFNLFFLFVKRSAIEASMPLFILIKLLAISFSMRFLLKNWIPDLSSWMRILLCIIYVFSPFNMSYFYVSRWSEMSFMFPLLMYGYFQLMNEGKKTVYVICLAIATMLSFQNIYMILLMLFLLTGLLALLNENKYKSRLGMLLWATSVGLMISAWLWIPGGLQISKANRATYTQNIFDIWNSVWIFHTGKWMKLWNMSIPLSCFLIYVWKNWRTKSAHFFGGVLLLLCAPIVLESTNILWHGGSYMGFTMRFSYMLAFWIISAGAYAYTKNELEKERFTPVILGIFCALVSVACAGVLYYFYIADNSSMKVRSLVYPMIVIVMVTTLMGIGIVMSKSHSMKFLTWIVVMVHSFSLALVSVYAAGEIQNSYIFASNELADAHEPENNPLIRVKSMDYTLSHNYPIIMEKHAASSFLPFNSQRQIEGMDSLGYARVGVRMSDYGGTLVSDALLGVQEVISGEEISKDLYQSKETRYRYTLYDSLYHYEQGIKLANPEMKIDQSENPFIYQNALAEAVVGMPLLDIVTPSGEEFFQEIEKKSVLYVYADNAEAFVSVIVEDRNTGKKLEIDLSETDWLNGILELGVWENAYLNVNIESSETVNGISYAILPLERFRKLVPEIYENFNLHRDGNSLAISLQGAKEGDFLYLPLYPDEGWKCFVNEEEVILKDFAQIAMAIPLQSGTNTIMMSFTPAGLPYGVIISILGLIMLVISFMLRNKKEWKTVNHVLWFMAEGGFAIFLLLFYVIPVIFLVKEVVL